MAEANSLEAYQAKVAKYSLALGPADFQDELDPILKDFGVAPGQLFIADGEYHDFKEFTDPASKGKTGYRAEQPTTQEGVRHFTATIYTHRHGGESQYYCGLKRVHELYKQRSLQNNSQHKDAASERVDRKPAPNVVEPKRAKLRGLLKDTIPLSHPNAEIGRDYLKERGLGLVLTDLPYDWRFHSALDYWHEVKGEWVSLGCYPALIGIIRGLDGKGCGIHRTYLGRDGRKLKLIDPSSGELLPAKKTMNLFPGATNGGAIRLYPVEETLAVAEGIETALAVRISTGFPVWATVSAGGMARLEVPEQVQEVVIMADLDCSETGEKSAKALAHRLLTQEIKSRIVLPNAEMLKAYQDQYDCVVRSLDWCDVLNTEANHE